MYSTKEKLHHFRQLANPLAAKADLRLLHEKNPQSTDFTRFDLAPQKNADDILFTLLDVAEHDEIVRNRRDFFAASENPNTDGGSENPNQNADGGEGNKEPNSNESETPETKEEESEAPVDNEEQTTDQVPSGNTKKEEEGAANKKPATPKKKKKGTPK